MYDKQCQGRLDKVVFSEAQRRLYSMGISLHLAIPIDSECGINKLSPILYVASW
jgi:hypothetical protein